VEAGTHRNDSGDSLNVAGIHVLQGVEDVNELRHLLVQCADAVFHLPHFALLHTGAKAEQASQQEQSKNVSIHRSSLSRRN
ncbi:hypothetical protein HMPREF9530_01985, partial [Escherichia coli MS 21-1]